jgi:inner membrane protein involved in colicin E2 resistance
MTQLVKINLGETEFWMEPDEEAVTEPMPIKTTGFQDIIKKGVPFDTFSKLVGDICLSFTKTMTNLPEKQRPNKFTTEFGFKISGTGNIIMVKTGAEASLKITAEWQIK